MAVRKNNPLVTWQNIAGSWARGRASNGRAHSAFMATPPPQPPPDATNTTVFFVLAHDMGVCGITRGGGVSFAVGNGGRSCDCFINLHSLCRWFGALPLIWAVGYVPPPRAGCHTLWCVGIAQRAMSFQIPTSPLKFLR